MSSFKNYNNYLDDYNNREMRYSQISQNDKQIIEELKKEMTTENTQIANPLMRKDPQIDMGLLLKVLNCSVKISDVFFDGMAREDRQLLESQVQDLIGKNLELKNNPKQSKHQDEIDKRTESLSNLANELSQQERKIETSSDFLKRAINEAKDATFHKAKASIQVPVQRIPISSAKGSFRRS